MSSLDNLIQQFEKFPGVGIRQAKRFAFHVLTLSTTDRQLLAEHITSLDSTVRECTDCHRFFSHHNGTGNTCSICSDPNRTTDTLMVVAHDADIDSIERSGVYQGQYFILGGTIPLLTSRIPAKIRSHALKERVTTLSAAGLQEIVLAFSVNPDGENTTRYTEQLLSELDANLTVKQLGRGLSTGSELEYADPETIKFALENRT